jgi:DNA-binding transcriptional ArsR family regulator
MDDAQVIEMYSTVLSAMGNPRRLAILALLADDEVNVSRLADHVGISQSALSQHLAKLRAAGLVSTRREGQMVFYSSCHASLVPMLSDLSDWLCSTPQPDLASS